MPEESPGRIQRHFHIYYGLVAAVPLTALYFLEIVSLPAIMVTALVAGLLAPFFENFHEELTENA